MKNLLLAGLALASLTFSATGCANQKEKAETATAGTSAAPDSATTPAGTGVAAATYTCTMHPEVTSSKPGKCPKCGMDLVKK